MNTDESLVAAGLFIVAPVDAMQRTCNGQSITVDGRAEPVELHD